MFVIEQGIPMPERRTMQVGNTIGMRKMQVGDSMFLPGGSYAANRAFWAAKKYFARDNKKLVSKKDGDGIRIWRIE